MKIKLDSVDMVEITKALKSGWLDMDKVSRFRELVNGYNPTEWITDKKLEYFLDCIYKGWGYKPNSENDFKASVMPGIELGLINAKWKERVESGSVYRELIKEIFIGLLAIKAIGGDFYDVEGDFSFMEAPIIKE